MKAIGKEQRRIIREELGAKKYGKISMEKMEEACEMDGEMGDRARLSLSLMKLRKKAE